MMELGADSRFADVQRALAGVYSIERELGRGGMGVVYLAREVELDRHVALKVLPPERAIDRSIRERFLREARVAASLSHPHIVPIYRVGEIADVVFFSMAFVDGGTLGERLRTRGPLPPAMATRMLREVAQALAYSHGRNVVHRDIKPDNILIERDTGRALVTDFGIAAAHGQLSDERVMGTAHFMSPEQAAGASVDSRSDLYSLSVVAFLSLSGRLPTGQSLSDASPSTPHHLVRAIDKGIAHAPDDRHATAEAFAAALESTTVARVALPTPLRDWLDTRDPWTVPYVGWSLAMTFTQLVTLSGGRASENVWIPAMFALLPIVPASIFQLRIARRAFDAGFSVHDLRDALRVWNAEHEANLTPRSPWWHAIARAVAWSPLLFLLGDAISPRLLNAISPHWAAVYYLVAAVISIPTLTALGIPILPEFLTPREKTLSRHLWGGRIGAWLERLLTKGRPRAVASSAFRPTESVLGSAVEDLVRALPSAFRAQLGDVADVVSRLQEHARVAREHLAHLDGVTAVDRDAQLGAARDRARQQLNDSVAALEMLRLDLLRLVGGDADLRPLTTALDAARRIDSDLGRLRSAQAETERAVRPLGLDLQPHTPT